MELQDILLEETATVGDAVEKLEKIRCKVVYVTAEGKLVASITDGDVRRYLLKNGDMNQLVVNLANYNPYKFYIYEKEEIENVLENTELFSVPIINYNQEVIAVHFKNGLVVSRHNRMECPIVMMAGGKGTRLYPYTKILPKALVPIGEIPIAELIIRRFKAYYCKEVYMIVNHKKSMIKAYFESMQQELDLQFVEETIFLGTGGGLSLLKSKVQEDFFLVNCDIIIDADYAEIYQYHKEQQNYITIVAAKYHQVIPYGVLVCDEQSNYVKMEEKPSAEYSINTGMYMVSHELIEHMEAEQVISFPQLIDISRAQGKKIGVYLIDEEAYMDMGQLEEMDRMKNKLRVE